MTTAQIMALTVSAVLAALLTPVMMRLARRWGVLDDPAVLPERKQHTRPIPLLGGVAIILATQITWLGLYFAGSFTGGDVTVKQLWGLVIAGWCLAVGGSLDDRWRLSAKQQVWWVLGAIAVVIAAGIGVRFITNPFGGFLDLTAIQWTIFHWHGLPYHLTLWADLFTLVWIFGTTYTTKILDGVDGLVSGLGVIGSVIVFLLTLRPEVGQSGLGLIALSLAGAAAGFLIWNWHPARVFLGESGSLYIGFLLGTLAIVSGGKIATALLILGLPILDLAWVIIQRWRAGTSPFVAGDRRHLHFRLLAAGLSVRQSVLLLYAVIAVFGLSTLYVSGPEKVLVLLGLLLLTALLVWWVLARTARQTPTHPSP